MKVFRLNNPLLLLLVLPVAFAALVLFALFFAASMLLPRRRRSSIGKRAEPGPSISKARAVSKGSVIEAEFHHVQNN